MNNHLISFGEDILEIRNEIGVTRSQVFELTGINPETIRRIENGKVIPKFETLELLSTIYKQDINKLFLDYRIHNHTLFYEIKNELERKLDEGELQTLDIELEKLNNLITFIDNPYYKDFIQQLTLLAEAVVLYKINKNNRLALKKLIEAVEITSPTFKLDSYKLFTYSSMEIRILMNIAFVLNRLSHKNKYTEILEYCMNLVDFNDKIYLKLCHNLAGAYIRNNNIEKSLELANKGIKACHNIRIYNNLNSLFYVKGIAEFKLHKKDYAKSIKTAIFLCEAFGQYELKDKIINNCKKLYGINLIEY